MTIPHRCQANGCTRITQFRFCRVHRKALAKKARARRSGRCRRPAASVLGHRWGNLTGHSAPTASEAFYREPRRNDFDDPDPIAVPV